MVDASGTGGKEFLYYVSSSGFIVPLIMVLMYVAMEIGLYCLGSTVGMEGRGREEACCDVLVASGLCQWSNTMTSLCLK